MIFSVESSRLNDAYFDHWSRSLVQEIYTNGNNELNPVETNSTEKLIKIQQFSWKNESENVTSKMVAIAFDYNM